MTQPAYAYDEASREAIYRVIRERRDMRHFVSCPVDACVLQRLLEAAHAAPSVGLSQPWRFIRITNPDLRTEIHNLVLEERARTADALASRGEEFLRLKVEGIRDCGELLVVAVRAGGDQEIFGRLSLPEMDLASTACAIQNLWLAARAEGLGMGWVSMFNVQRLMALLHCPQDVRPVAIICLGHVEQFYTAPMLVLERWRQPRELVELMFENGWGG